MGRRKCQIIRNYFEVRDGEGKLRCKVGSCTSTISDHATNLLKHLEMFHPDEFTQVMMAKVEISNTELNTLLWIRILSKDFNTKPLFIRTENYRRVCTHVQHIRRIVLYK
ncbi:uncharacterized protein LOC143375033 isoform X2 [Andrena cerasifolii]|uniref:uncharacterized protein LOC143375033 isoform X2 n=1 Tax=Andrena cerasifolii TaxID=2819439 RepID=UPI004037F3E0